MMRRVVAGVALTLALVGCGSENQPKEEATMDASTTLTEALAEYGTFNDDLVERLDEAFGSKPWAVAADSGGQSLCDDGRRAFLPRRQFPGAYDAASFEKVRDLVIEVGKEHGFAEPTLLLEKPGYLEIVAPDETGGEYSFVMGEKTSVVTSTGCHPVG
jgi:hypothetical protein